MGLWLPELEWPELQYDDYDLIGNDFYGIGEIFGKWVEKQEFANPELMTKYEFGYRVMFDREIKIRIRLHEVQEAYKIVRDENKKPPGWKPSTEWAFGAGNIVRWGDNSFRSEGKVSNFLQSNLGKRWYIVTADFFSGDGVRYFLESELTFVSAKGVRS